ncbi:MAG: hypothetical protein ACTSVE_05995 [Candidatus Helarchaeota archaeon]
MIIKKRRFTVSLLITLFMLGMAAGLPGNLALSYNGTCPFQDTIVWYRASVTSGQFMQLDLSFSASNDFDLYIAISIFVTQNMAGRFIPDNDVAHSINSSGSSEQIKYIVKITGIIFVAVHSHSGSGAFTLTSNVQLQEFNPILEIILWIVLISALIAVPIVIVYLVRRKRRGSVKWNSGLEKHDKEPTDQLEVDDNIKDE